MRGVTLNNVCHCGLFTYVFIFSFISLTTSVSFDLTELRNKVASIKVNPRGKLWATGHFMGKKSVMDSPLMPSTDELGADGLEAALGTEQNELGDLLQEMLRVALQAQVDTQESLLKKQETGLLMKIFENYILNKRK